MVRDFIATYDQGIAPEAVSHLRDSIESHLGELMKSARRAARDAFRQKPKKFEKRISKSVAPRPRTPRRGQRHERTSRVRWGGLTFVL